MRHRLLASSLAVFVLVLAAFTGTSLAGNGHGHGGGGDHGQWSSGQPSAQAQPDSQSQYQSQPQPQSQPSSHDSHGDSHHGGWSKQSDTSPSAPATGGDNSQGVKPSSTTKHDTYAKASSDKTKEYGNGKTAGEIATHAGYGDATLHGPGNSQPHKTACGGHEVDVHALKSHGSKCGSSEQPAVVQHETKTTKKPCPKKHSSVEATKVEHTTVVKTKKPCPKKHGSVEATKVAKPKVPEQKPAPAPAQHSPVAGVSASAHQHVTICHATGSASNPYVRISPSAAGVFHGHLGHQEGRDIVPPFVWNGQSYSENWDTSGQAIWNAGCATPAPAAVTPAAPAAPAPTQTPAQPVAVTTTPAPAPAAPTPTNGPAAPAPKPAPAVVTQVKAATHTLSKPKATNRTAAAPTAATPKARGGVLGTTTRLGSTVAGTTLPFTGLPLWIFAAVAAGLILIGAAMRRSAHDRA
jgi:hypothetical protein